MRFPADFADRMGISLSSLRWSGRLRTSTAGLAGVLICHATGSKNALSRNA